MGESRILLGSASFKQRLEETAANAKESLFVQAMTFEGDAAGEWLLGVMKSSPAKDKRLLIDSYSKVVINDHFIFSLKYLFDEYFRAEIKNTKKVVQEAQKIGIRIQFTNPVGLFGQRYPLRNHKKMVIVDGDISYLGGINFSDHNFAWHDMMVEVQDPILGKKLLDDFEETWKGENQSTSYQLEIGDLFLFNGVKSTKEYKQLFDHVRNAKEEVQVISPYISEPLLQVLRETASKGIKITIISPRENNKSIFKNIILAEKRKGYFDLKEYPGMSHMKAILVDDEKLIFGSSNYDLISYYFEQEVVFLSKDRNLINAFKDEVLVSAEEIDEVEATSSFQERKAAMIMNLVDRFSDFASKTFLTPK